MVKLTPKELVTGGRIGQQVGVKPTVTRAPPKPKQPTTQQVAEVEAEKTKPTTDYDRAWETAKGHWLKGKSGAYLYHMQEEATRDPQIAAVYNYVKELQRQTKAGNISPGRAKGSLLATKSEQDKILKNIEAFQKEDAARASRVEEMKAPVKQVQESFVKEGEIQRAPTQKQYFKESVAERGLIKGTLSYFGEGASSLFWRGQTKAVKKFGGKYDPQVAELGGKAVEVTPYFTPAGPLILSTAGAEELITPSGRERIKTQAQQYEEMGWSPSLARTAAFAQPTIELGIGAVGVGLDIKKLKTISEVGKAETRFIARETPVKQIEGVGILPQTSRVKIISETKIGKERTFGVSQQDIFKVGDDYSLGLSKGYQFREPKTVIMPRGKIVKEYDIEPITGVGYNKLQIQSI